MVSWKELTASFRRLRIVQEALGQRKILLLLFIFGQENLNSIYPHETAKSHFLFFIRILELLARQQNQDVESNWGRYCEPCAFEKLLEEYDTLIVDYYDELSRDPSRNYVNPFKNTKNETRSR